MKKVIIIAEAGVNHNGDIKLAKKLIDAASEAKVDYVKFQSFRAIVSVRFSTSDERPVAGNAIGRETVVVGRKKRESSMGEVKKISRGVRRERLGSFRRVS